MYGRYLNSILNFFSTMDIDGLRLYLKDEYSYQDTTKEIFLHELGSIFESYKNSGDTELILYTGKCAGKSCANCGKKGYRFVGNHSKNYIDLLFITEGDEIIDIFSCNEFETTTLIENLGMKAEIYVQTDDKITFEKTHEYLSKILAAEEAYNEIIRQQPRQLDFSALSEWLDKYSLTDKLIGSYDVFDEIMHWTPFSALYFHLKEVKEFVGEFIIPLQRAAASIREIDSEDKIRGWLEKYKPLYEISPMLFRYAIKREEDYYFFNMKGSIQFVGKGLIAACTFLDYYSSQSDPFY